MTITAPVLATPLPPAPNTNDPDNFDDLADARIEAEGPFGDQINALALNMYNNATEAQARALQAQQAAADAQSAAAAAAAATTAVKWVAGNYGDGDVAWSPISRFSYRRIGDGASATDPALDAPHWVLQLYALGLGGMVITGSVDLNVTSGGAISVTPATPGLYITLPDATTLPQGAVVFHAFNAGVYDIGVKNKAGVVLGWIRPGTSSVIGLASNATLAGVWTTSNLHKLGITAQLNVPAVLPLQNGLAALKRVTLDVNRTLFVFGALYAVVYDSSTQQWGSPVAIRSVAINSSSAILISADKVLVLSMSGSQLEAIVLSISGTSITPNTPVPGTTAGVTGLSDMIAVGGAFAYGSYNLPSAATYINAITVTGTTPAFGPERTFSANRGCLPCLFVSGSILRAVALDGGSNVGLMTCTPYSVSGNSLSAGTPATGGNSLNLVYADQGLRCFQNDNGNIISLGVAGTLQVSLFKLTGTVEAVSYSSTGIPVSGAYLFDYVRVSGTKTALVGVNGGAVSWNIHVDTNGTGSAGIADGITFSFGGEVHAVGATGNSARFALTKLTYNGAPIPPTQLQLDCSSTSAVKGYCQSRWNVNMPDSYVGGKLPRHFTLLSAGANQYCIGGDKSFDSILSSAGIQISPSLGENPVGGIYGAAANESWIVCGLNVGFGLTFGTTIKRIEAAA